MYVNNISVPSIKYWAIFCNSRRELFKCTACRYVYYCGRQCQKEAWCIHKLECYNLKLIAPRVLPDAARILARLIKILGKGGAYTKSYYTKRNFRTFKDLMSRKYFLFEDFLNKLSFKQLTFVWNFWRNCKNFYFLLLSFGVTIFILWLPAIQEELYYWLLQLGSK